MKFILAIFQLSFLLFSLLLDSKILKLTQSLWHCLCHKVISTHLSQILTFTASSLPSLINLQNLLKDSGVLFEVFFFLYYKKRVGIMMKGLGYCLLRSNALEIKHLKSAIACSIFHRIRSHLFSALAEANEPTPTLTRQILCS